MTLTSQARLDTENWCGVLQEVALPGTALADPDAFLPAAVQFANDRCWGNLSCSLFVSPQVPAASKVSLLKHQNWQARLVVDGGQ